MCVFLFTIYVVRWLATLLYLSILVIFFWHSYALVIEDFINKRQKVEHVSDKQRSTAIDKWQREAVLNKAYLTMQNLKNKMSSQSDSIETVFFSVTGKKNFPCWRPNSGWRWRDRIFWLHLSRKDFLVLCLKFNLKHN